MNLRSGRGVTTATGEGESSTMGCRGAAGALTASLEEKGLREGLVRDFFLFFLGFLLLEESLEELELEEERWRRFFFFSLFSLPLLLLLSLTSSSSLSLGVFLSASRAAPGQLRLSL